MLLKGKKIIITAGPVWVAIDKVRVMTNIFGGRLGYEIAKKASQEGAEVLLLLGPGRVEFADTDSFKVRRFKYYPEISSILKKEITSKKYDVVIQSAAIPDYVPVEFKNEKIKSGSKELILKFKPTKKIIDQMKGWDPSIFLVKFKLEVDKDEDSLIEIAYRAMEKSRADLIVANELGEMKGQHRAFVIDLKKNVSEVAGKSSIAQCLVEKIAKSL